MFKKDDVNSSYLFVTNNRFLNAQGDIGLSGGRVDILSVEDTYHMQQQSRGGNASLNKGFTDSAWVNNQTSLIGTNSVNVDADSVHLKGSVIANVENGTDKGNLNITSNNFSYEDIKDHVYSEQKGFGADVGTGDVSSYETGKTTISVVSKGSEKEQETRATVGAGAIIIAGEEATSEELEGLNRDVDKAQEVTRDQITGASDYSVTIDHKVAKKIVEETANGVIAVTKETVNAISLLTTSGKKEVFVDVSLQSFNGKIDANIAFLKEQANKEVDPSKKQAAIEYIKQLERLKELNSDLNPSFWKKIFGENISRETLEKEFYLIQSNIQNLPYYDSFQKAYRDAVIKSWSQNPEFINAVENFDKWSTKDQNKFLKEILKDGQKLFGKNNTSSLLWSTIDEKGNYARGIGYYNQTTDLLFLNSNMNKYSDTTIWNANGVPTGNINTNLFGVLAHEMTHSMQYYMYKNDVPGMQGDLWRLSFLNYYSYDPNSPLGNNASFNRYQGQSVERDARESQNKIGWGLQKEYQGFKAVTNSVQNTPLAPNTGINNNLGGNP